MDDVPVPEDIWALSLQIADAWEMPENIAVAIALALSNEREAQRELCAAWHDQRARDTPDAFEMEFHQASAAAFRVG